MKKLFLILIFIPLISFGQPCQVFGKVKFVEYGEDYKIKIVDFNEDCRVRLVNYNANKTGLWQIDEYDSRAIKIKIVEFGEDFRVKEVSGEFNLKRPSNLQAGKIDYGNSGNSGYNKYKDANRYQSGGATEQQMVGDAIDAAMEERRLLRQRANSRNNSVDYTIHNRGIDEMNSENWEYALQLFNQFLAYYPNDPSGLYNRALTKDALGDRVGGCRDLRISAEMGYRSAQEMLSKGGCNNNVTSKSNKTPDRSSKNIKQPEKFREEGRNEYEKGNYQEALKAMDIAIKMLNDQAYEFGEMTEKQTSNFNKHMGWAAEV